MFEIGNVAGEHDEPIIIGSRHEMAVNHGRTKHDGAFEVFERLLALTVERDPDHDGHGIAEPFVTDCRMIAGDDPALFQGFETAGAGCARQADTRRQVDDARSRIGDQNGQDGPVEAIQIQTFRILRHFSNLRRFTAILR